MIPLLPELCAAVMEAAWLSAAAVTPLCFNLHSAEVFDFNKTQAVRFLALIAGVAWILKGAVSTRSLRDNGRRAGMGFRRLAASPLSVPVLAFVAAYGLATPLSVAPWLSWTGSRVRAQGFASILAYAVLFFALAGGLRSQAQWRRLQFAVILASVPAALYGILQGLGIDPLAWFETAHDRVRSTLGNPIYLAGYLIMVAPLTAERLFHYASLLRSGQQDRKPALAGLLAAGLALSLQLIAIIFTQSRGPWLALAGSGFVAVFILLLLSRPPESLAGRDAAAGIAAGCAGPVLVLLPLWNSAALPGRAGGRLAMVVLAALLGAWASLIFLGRGRRWLWLAWLVQGLVAPLLLVLLLNLQGPSARAVPYLGRLSLLGQAEDETSEHRLTIWRSAVDRVRSDAPLSWPDGALDRLHPVRSLAGYGPESVALVTARQYRPSLIVPSRTHNQVLESQITLGAVGVIAYLTLFAAAFFRLLDGLGLISGRVESRLCILVLSGMTALGAVLPVVLDAAYLAGLGATLGMGGGVLAYAAIVSVRGRRAGLRPGSVLILCLLANVFAHFMETGVGIANTTTLVYLFLLLGAIPFACSSDSPGESDEKRRPGAAPERNLRNPRKDPGVGRRWSAVLPYGLIAGLVLILLDWAFVANPAGLADAAEVFLKSWFTRLGPDSRPVFQPAALWTVVATLVLGGLMCKAEVGAAVNRTGRGGGAMLPFLVVSGTVWLVFGGPLADRLMFRFAGASVVVVTRHINGLVHFLYLGVGLALSGLAWSLKRRDAEGSGPVRRASWPACLVAFLWIAGVVYGTVSWIFPPIHADVAARLGNGFQRSGDWERSIAAFEASVAESPRVDFYWRRLGEALVFAARAGGEASVRNSYLDRAEQAFRRAFELMPLDAVNLRSLASLEIERGDALREPGERTKAIRRALPYFEKALVLAPTSPDLFNEWSQVYFLTGDFQKAAERLERSLELAPKYIPTHMHLGELQLRQGKLDESLKAYTAALQIDPTHIEARNNRASVLRALGRNQEAIDESLAVLSLAPDDLKALQRLAYLHESIGDREHALVFARRAMALLPEAQRSGLAQLIDRLTPK